MINYKLKRLELKLNLLNITNNNEHTNQEDDFLLKSFKSPPLSSNFNNNNNKQQQIFNYLVTPSCSSPILPHSNSCNSPSFCSSFKPIKGFLKIKKIFKF